ncbi:unnamed protein product [Didymodactylos carnosus]|uniref:Uncharacterized protein n=1 Tax=Didymodactylos carnosus TaxID=1234261 RepID=A0A814EBI2_9BILA|nr:unnamed protein product [Didymodactylos carnosus]CAF1119627.1 unnamed protein product [Didymodactylos carnosus]CAF3738831.1 unnamed protein product [Didymodactylos carnosus]CAF3892572.1 unnamed protein product [Didymodactylos carnosus]
MKPVEGDGNSRLPTLVNETIQMLENVELDDRHRRNAHHVLEHWRTQSIARINETHVQKSNEINLEFEKLQNDFNYYKHRHLIELEKKILPNLKQSTKPDELLLMYEQVTKLQQDIQILNSKNLLNISYIIGSIDDLKITKTTDIFDRQDLPVILRQLQQQPIKQHIFSSTCRAMASSNEHILLYDKNELIIFDLNNLCGTITWSTSKQGYVSDMCWCPFMNVFLVLGRLSLNIFDPSIFDCKDIPNVKGTNFNSLISICCYENDVFICSHDPEQHLKYYSLPSWKNDQKWSKNDLCLKDDLGIRCIRTNGIRTAMIIKQKNDLFRVDIFNYELGKVLQSITMGSYKNSKDFTHYMTLLNQNQWLCCVNNEHAVVILDEYGQKYRINNMQAYNACLFSTTHMILRYADRIAIMII